MAIFIPPYISAADLATLVLKKGQLVYNTDDGRFYTGDGVTAGGLLVNLGDVQKRAIEAQASLKLLRDQIERLAYKDTVVVKPEGGAISSTTEADKPITVSGQITEYPTTSGGKAAVVLTAPAVKISQVETAISAVYDNLYQIKGADEVKIENSQFAINQYSANSNVVKVFKGDELTVSGVKFTGTTYNTIMTGQSTSGSFLKNVLIEDCDFAQDCRHCNIWLGGWQDGAVVTIKNCHFASCTQFIAIGDFHCAGASGEPNSLTVNVVDCVFDKYEDSGEWSGLFYLDVRNTGPLEQALAFRPFKNTTINVRDCMVKGVRMTQDMFKMGTGQTGQMLYIFHAWNKVGTAVKFSEYPELFPTVTVG